MPHPVPSHCFREHQGSGKLPQALYASGLRQVRGNPPPANFQKRRGSLLSTYDTFNRS